MNSRPYRTVLIGSYSRDASSLARCYDELVATGCQVLSPHTLDFDQSEFVRTAAESTLSPLELENYHLLCIRQADFVWLHAPDGYVGISGAFEIGYALALNRPIFSRTTPTDVMLRQYVQLTSSVFEAQRQTTL